MSGLGGFSNRLRLLYIPEGPGVVIVEDSRGEVLLVLASDNVRRRIGALLDSEGTVDPHGPRIHKLHHSGREVYARWKRTPEPEEEQKRLVERFTPAWD